MGERGKKEEQGKTEEQGLGVSMRGGGETTGGIQSQDGGHWPTWPQMSDIGDVVSGYVEVVAGDYEGGSLRV